MSGGKTVKPENVPLSPAIPRSTGIWQGKSAAISECRSRRRGKSISEVHRDFLVALSGTGDRVTPVHLKRFSEYLRQRFE